MHTPHHPRSPFLRHSAIALAISLGFAGAVQAQSAEGTLFGRTTAGATVSIVNVDTGLQRQTTAEAGGNFTFSKLQPGRYKVTSGGVTREVVVALGSGTEVKLDVQELERIEISGRGVRTMIDVASVESSTVFTAEQLRALPVARNVDAVALLAPGVVKGDADLGDNGGLPSFAGASVAENGYYINGFDVTNIRNFLSYANLPFEAIAQQQIKTGGYGAEYGRSLGGVISLLTKRGTNEWKGGASVYWEPQALRSKGVRVANKETDLDSAFPNLPPYTHYYYDTSLDRREVREYNAYVGGPVIKDKLFVFGLVEGRSNTTDTFEESQSTRIKDTNPNWLVKVDFAPTDNHLFEYTGIKTKSKRDYYDYESATPYSGTLDGAPGVSERTAGGRVDILKYTGYLTDDFTVSALAGRVTDQQPIFTGARLNGADCPTVYNVGATAPLGCWNGIFPGAPGRDPAAPPTDIDKRKAYRLDLEYVFGKHTIRAGLDNQTFTSGEAGGSAYSGGIYWRYFVTPAAGGTVRGVALPGNTPYVRARISQNTTGEYEVKNSAYYIEDSFKVTKNVLLYGGLRWESFDNKNSDGVSFVKKDREMAPRLGFSWDANGDSTLKIYGNLGRYYIPVASNTNIRATRGELSTEAYYTYTGQDPRTAAPTGTTQIGTTLVNSDGRIPNPATIAATNLSPMNQDEFILGMQKAIAKGWTAGAKFTYRKINSGMDDFCGHYAMEDWAADNGYTNFDSHTLASCIVLNPGKDVGLAMDLKNDGTLTNVTIPASYFRLAPYSRTYKALELSVEKPFDGKWGLQFSYVLAKSRGTAEGYVQSQLNQEDAGITQDFDFGSFTDGAKGYLPNDRRHTFKLFGTYAVTEEVSVGLNAVLTSGRPYSCIGFVPNTVPDFAETWTGSASSYYCRTSTTQVSLIPRGTAGRTPWTHQFDMQFAYKPKWASNRLTLQADVFNVFNSRKATEYNELRDYSYATSETAPYRQNANYGSPTATQEPRYVRLSGRYEF